MSGYTLLYTLVSHYRTCDTGAFPFFTALYITTVIFLFCNMIKILNILILYHLTCSDRRPSGVPDHDLCSFLMPYYQKQEAYMRLELKKIQIENASLAQKVQAGRESIAQTEHRISTAVDEWKVSGRSKNILCK